MTFYPSLKRAALSLLIFVGACGGSHAPADSASAGRVATEAGSPGSESSPSRAEAECGWVALPIVLQLPEHSVSLDYMHRRILAEVLREGWRGVSHVPGRLIGFRVEGHTETCGDARETNATELSFARALSVARELRTLGFSGALRAVGFGGTRPRFTCPRGELDCGVDRRVELAAWICTDGDMPPPPSEVEGRIEDFEPGEEIPSGAPYRLGERP